MAGNGGPAAQSGIGIHLYGANRDMAGALLLRRRRRAAAGAAGRPPAHRHRAGRAGDRAAADRGDPARRALPRGTAGRCLARLRVRELRRLPAPAGAGSDRFQRPGQSRAISNRRWRPTRTSRASSSCVAKFQGQLWSAKIGHSPLDVVAWHGNYAPYRYDLRRFNTIGSISYDHPDPSIFTVLTSPSDTAGTANLDFAIFGAALAGGRGHLPPAVVPPQHRQRVHGPDPRRVRRQGGRQGQRRLRAGRSPRCTTA